MNTKKCSALSLLIAATLSACSSSNIPVLDGTKAVSNQYLDYPTPCIQDIQATRLADDCGGTPAPDPTPPNTEPYEVHPMQELYDLANRLGVSPAAAGVPGAETMLTAQSSRSIGTLSYPTDGTDALDFMDKLYARATSPAPSTVPVYGTTTNDPTCSTRVVDVNSPATWFLGGDGNGGAGNDQALYAGSLLQGGYVNAGVGSLRRIYSGKVAGLTLTSTLQNTTVQANVPPYLADVNAAVGRMTTSAPSSVGGLKYAQVVEASSVNEATQKLGIKGKLGPFTGSVDTIYTNDSTRSTVFVLIQQSSFWVDVSLQNRPLISLFDNISKADLEALGADDQLGYNNLPLYVNRTIYGRALLFSISSNVSTQELSVIANAAWGTGNSASLNSHQKSVINQSHIRGYSYGGSGTPLDSAFKDGSYKSFFTADNDPRTMLPVGYDFKRLDRYGTSTSTFNPLRYTERTCNPYKTVQVNLSEIIGTARIFVRRPSRGYEEMVTAVTGDTLVDLTNMLDDGNNEIRVESSPNSNWSNQRGVRSTVFVDDVQRDTVQIDCRRTRTNDVYLATINKTTGQIISHSLPNGRCP